MKVIFSRKGFDSANGGMPSPILPDGRLAWFPIPSTSDCDAIGGVFGQDCTLLGDLSKGRWSNNTRVHFDPDLVESRKLREAGWRPSLGQNGAAESHLRSQGVDIGDVFIFFSWFRDVRQRHGRWEYVSGAPDLHVMFGWLEVGEIFDVGSNRQDCLVRAPWIRSHPHIYCSKRSADTRNVIYVAARRSRFSPRLAGSGLFDTLKQQMVLTAAGRSRSVWCLPRSFYPHSGLGLSYHRDLKRWALTPNSALLRTVAKGQEFVVDVREDPDLRDWVSRLIVENV